MNKIGIVIAAILLLMLLPSPVAAQDPVELVLRRTEFSKTYLVGEQTYRYETGGDIVHWKENYGNPAELWKDVDLTWQGNRIDKAPYILVHDGNTITLTCRKTGDSATIELLTVGGRKVPAQAWTRAAGLATAPGITGINLKVQPNTTGVAFSRVLSDERKASEATFRVEMRGTGVTLRVAAQDATGRDLPMASSMKDGVLTEALDLDAVDFAVVYPVTVDPVLEVQPSSKDTFIQNLAGIYTMRNFGAYTGMELRDLTTNRCRGLFSFDTPGIPGGATVIDASLSLYYGTYWGTNPSGKTMYAYRLDEPDWAEYNSTWSHYDGLVVTHAVSVLERNLLGSRLAQRINSFPATTINSVTVWLKRQSPTLSPTSDVFVRVRNVSDDAILGTLGSLSPSSISSSGGSYTFSSTPVAVPTVRDIRITVEQPGSAYADMVYVYRVMATAGGYDTRGMYSYYQSGAWTDTTDELFLVATTDLCETWATAGGDYTTVAPGGGSDTFPASAGQWMEWDITDIADDSVGSDSVNLLLRFATETLSSGDSTVWFASRENSTSSWRPTLSMTYYSTTPVVDTMAATYIGMYSARLNSYVQYASDLPPIELRFQYNDIADLNDPSTTSTAWVDGFYSGQSHYASLTGLTDDQAYWFRAQARMGGNIYTFDTLTFTTASSFGAPSGLYAYTEDDRVVLAWTKGAGTEGTLVRYQLGSYPALTTDGALVGTTEGGSIVHEDLSYGTTYYYTIWGYAGANYTGAVNTMITTSAGDADASVSGPTTPTLWFTSSDYMRLSAMPLYDEVNDFADSLSVPRGTMWTLGALGLCALLGLVVFMRTRYPAPALVVFALLMLVMVLLRMLPGWMLVFVIIFFLGATRMSSPSMGGAR